MEKGRKPPRSTLSVFEPADVYNWLRGRHIYTYRTCIHMDSLCSNTYTIYALFVKHLFKTYSYIRTIYNSITYLRTCTHIMCVDLEKNPRRQCWCQTESVDTQMAKRNAIASMSTYTRTNARFHMPAQNYYAVMQDECK